MSWVPIYVLCFAVGTLWSVASLLLSGMHAGHSAQTGSPHLHGGRSFACWGVPVRGSR